MTKAWVVNLDVRVFSECLKQNCVAVAFPGVLDPSIYSKANFPNLKRARETLKHEILASLSNNPLNALRDILNSLVIFVREMAEGDFVLCPDAEGSEDSRVFVGTIQGRYNYVGEKDRLSPFNNRRKTIWINSFLRYSLPEEIEYAIAGTETIYAINRHLKTIKLLVEGNY